MLSRFSPDSLYLSVSLLHSSSERIRAFTAMVDKKRTRAATYVNGVDHVLEILQPLAAASQPPVMSE